MTFDGSLERDRTRFAVLYAGFVRGGDQAPDTGMETLRLKAGILAALQGVSDRPAGLSDGITGIRVLRAGTHAIDLDGEQLRTLIRYVSNCQGWATEAVPDVIEAIDWLRTLG